MSERLSTMPPHGLMPYSIPRTIDSGRRSGHHQIIRQPARQPSARKPSDVNRKTWEYICFAEAVPGPEKEVLVTAQLRGVTVTGEFIRQLAERSEDPLVFSAKARIGLNQEGFIAVLADGETLRMRVGNAAGPLQQEVAVKTPPYHPTQLVVKYNNGLIIASA